MDLTKLAIYKEKMIIAKETNNKDDFEKYYKLYSEEYKKVTGKDCSKKEYEEKEK